MIRQRPTTTKTATATLTVAEMGDILCNSSSAQEYTLPAVSFGLWYRLTNINTGVVTVGSKTLSQGESCLCNNEGTAWIYTKTSIPYTHPTGDGNLHVPANSTTNSGKVLTAGAAAGTYTWETPDGGSGLVGTKEVDETDIANAKILQYNSTSGKLEYETLGAAANGIPVGGTADQILAKIDGTDFNAEWVDAPSGGATSAADVSIVDTAELYTSTDVEGALAELFTSVSSGKTDIATAITDKGVDADGSDTFTILAEKIGVINSTNALSVSNSYGKYIAEIPTMTSATNPSGVVTVSGTYSTNSGYKAFDGDDGTYWRSNTVGAPAWIAYEFPSPKTITAYRLKQNNSYKALTWTFDGWNGTSWDELSSNSFTELDTLIYINNATSYLKYRVNIDSMTTTSCGIYELEMYSDD